MRPKDIIIDIFGDYVRYTNGSIRLAHLIEILTLFDIEPSTARVTLSRMRRDGWLKSSRHGREVSYQATKKLLNVLDDGYERIFGVPSFSWSGQWTMVLYQIPETKRKARGKVKRALSWEGFGQLNSTTWISPHDLREKMHAELKVAGKEDIHVVTVLTGELQRDREFAYQCWDLNGIAETYRKFLDHWRPVLDEVHTIHGKDALRLRLKLVWDYRRFPLMDPGLPNVLLPDDWPGMEAYEAFRQLHLMLGPEANTQFYALTKDLSPQTT